MRAFSILTMIPNSAWSPAMPLLLRRYLGQPDLLGDTITQRPGAQNGEGFVTVIIAVSRAGERRRASHPYDQMRRHFSIPLFE